MILNPAFSFYFYTYIGHKIQVFNLHLFVPRQLTFAFYWKKLTSSYKLKCWTPMISWLGTFWLLVNFSYTTVLATYTWCSVHSVSAFLCQKEFWVFIGLHMLFVQTESHSEHLKIWNEIQDNYLLQVLENVLYYIPGLEKRVVQKDDREFAEWLQNKDFLKSQLRHLMLKFMIWQSNQPEIVPSQRHKFHHWDSSNYWAL